MNRPLTYGRWKAMGTGVIVCALAAAVCAAGQTSPRNKPDIAVRRIRLDAGKGIDNTCWSSDRRYVAFVQVVGGTKDNPTRRIEIVDVAKQTVVYRSMGPLDVQPVWMPGSHILYYSHGAHKGADIRRVNAADQGAATSIVTTGLNWLAGPTGCWLDRTHLVFFRSAARQPHELAVVDDGGRVRPLRLGIGDDPICPAVSPDGRSIAYIAKRSEPRLMKVVTRAGKVLFVSGKGAGTVYEAYWTLDKDVLLYLSWNRDHGELHRVTLSKRQDRMLARLGTIYCPTSVNRFNEVALCTGNDAHPDAVRIYSATDGKLLAHADSHVFGAPSWSPDGSKLALYDRSTQPGGTLTIVDRRALKQFFRQ